MVVAVGQWSAVGVPLAGWTGVDEVKFVAMLLQVFESISLVKLVSTIMRLRSIVDSHNVESSTLVAFCCPACSAEKVK